MGPIFVEHWGDNLQFYPNFARFSTLGGMNLEHDFVRVWKFSEDKTKNKKKTANGTLFPQIQVKTKKVFNKNRTLFSPNLRSDVHPFKLWGDADVDHSQTIGGYIQSIGRDISPLVSAPLIAFAISFFSRSATLMLNKARAQDVHSSTKDGL